MFVSCRRKVVRLDLCQTAPRGGHQGCSCPRKLGCRNSGARDTGAECHMPPSALKHEYIPSRALTTVWYPQPCSIVWYYHIGHTKKLKVKSITRVQLFATLWTVAHQAPPSMGFPRQEYWNGLPFPSPGDLPGPRIEPGSTTLQADTSPSEPPGKLY